PAGPLRPHTAELQQRHAPARRRDGVDADRYVRLIDLGPYRQYSTTSRQGSAERQRVGALRAWRINRKRLNGFARQRFVGEVQPDRAGVGLGLLLVEVVLLVRNVQLQVGACWNLEGRAALRGNRLIAGLPHG